MATAKWLNGPKFEIWGKPIGKKVRPGACTRASRVNKLRPSSYILTRWYVVMMITTMADGGVGEEPPSQARREGLAQQVA